MRLGESRLYVIPISCLLITLYFCVHAVSGARGLKRLEQVNAEIVLASDIAKETRAEKESLQRKVRALSVESLDLDQLEESAMRVLNMGRPDDMVILK
ncbi:MAG: septum formation initiator family protein [Alphaproteobacteria bacterium]|nr:septum formation initiator family protein [Alphaproteobacteria bacterium]